MSFLFLPLLFLVVVISSLLPTTTVGSFTGEVDRPGGGGFLGRQLAEEQVEHGRKGLSVVMEKGQPGPMNHRFILLSLVLLLFLNKSKRDRKGLSEVVEKGKPGPEDL